MSGRPSNKDRQNALALGLSTYTGSPHKKCGTDQRYTSGGGCVHCNNVRAAEGREALRYLKKLKINPGAEIDGRGDQGGGYPSSQDTLDRPDPMALRRTALDDLM